MAATAGECKPIVRRLANVGLLVGGFGLGQGSIFLAQTWLVATGRMELLAAFGLNFSLAMLGIIAVEAGSLTVLARQTTTLIATTDGRQAIWQAYWETTVFRLVVAGLVIAAALSHALIWSDSAFTSAYLVWGSPAFLIWALSGAGLLDGLQKSGISGLTGSIAYVASAIALVLAADLPSGQAGTVLGAALSLGYGTTLLVQHAALGLSGLGMRPARPRASGIRTAFAEEGAMLAGLLPGQFYFRIQLLLAASLLGANATALLVYAKQITGAIGQVAGFVRRVEFPSIVGEIARMPDAPLIRLIQLQAMSLGLSVLAAIGLVGLSIVIAAQLTGFGKEAWGFLSIFAITIASEALGQTLVQTLFGHGRYVTAGLIRIVAVCCGVLAAWLLIGPLGILAFVAADLVSHGIVSSASAIAASRKAAP